MSYCLKRDLARGAARSRATRGFDDVLLGLTTMNFNTLGGRLECMGLVINYGMERWGGGGGARK